MGASGPQLFVCLGLPEQPRQARLWQRGSDRARGSARPGAGGGDRTLSALAVYGNAIFGAAGELREFGITAFIWLMLFSS